jgi:hypothetical protein
MSFNNTSIIAPPPPLFGDNESHYTSDGSITTTHKHLPGDPIRRVASASTGQLASKSKAEVNTEPQRAHSQRSLSPLSTPARPSKKEIHAEVQAELEVLLLRFNASQSLVLKLLKGHLIDSEELFGELETMKQSASQCLGLIGSQSVSSQRGVIALHYLSQFMVDFGPKRKNDWTGLLPCVRPHFYSSS